MIRTRFVEAELVGAESARVLASKPTKAAVNWSIAARMFSEI
jgi:hypothetical protein